MIIYKTTNLINGKIYIGQDSKNNPKYLGSGVIFLKALKKYGKENFKKEIIDTALTIDELNDKEIFWINENNSTNQIIGYNVSFGGSGITLPKEVLLKKSEKAKKEGTYKGKNNGNYKYEIIKEELYEKYIILNLKIDEIAKYYGCHKTVITKKIKEYSIQKPLSNKYNFKKDDLYKYYMVDNLSYTAISKIYGCSHKTIFKIVKKYGWENNETIKFVREPKYNLTYDNLFNDLIINKLSRTEVQNKYNCSKQVLSYNIKKHKLNG